MAKTDPKRKMRSKKFPLTLHPMGQYCKKIRGKLYYVSVKILGHSSLGPVLAPLAGVGVEAGKGQMSIYSVTIPATPTSLKTRGQAFALRFCRT